VAGGERAGDAAADVIADQDRAVELAGGPAPARS
jgi:hypothetical protein